MVRYRIVASCAVVLALLMAGCAVRLDDASTPEQVSPTTSPQRTDHDPTSRKQAGLFFPRVPEGPREYLQATTSGRLVVRHRCIRVGTSQARGGIVVWPHGYSLRREYGEVLVLDGRGEVVAKVGDEVRMSGGQVNAESLLPDACRGPAPEWLASGVF